MSVNNCPVVVNIPGHWRGYVCGKPIKRNGLCASHAAGQDRRAANAAKRAVDERRRDELRAAAESAVAEIEALCPALKAQAHYLFWLRGLGEYDAERVVVNTAALLALLQPKEPTHAP